MNFTQRIDIELDYDDTIARRAPRAERTRRPPRRGCTTKKGNRYHAVVYQGVDPATGKERRPW